MTWIPPPPPYCSVARVLYFQFLSFDSFEVYFYIWCEVMVQIHYFANGYSVFLAPLLKRMPFTCWIVLVFLSIISWPYMRIYLWDFCSISLFYICPYATAAAKLLQSCLTLCDSIDGSPPGSPVPGILQARTLEWVAISFSRAWKWKVKVKSLSRVRPLATPWTAAHQAPPSMGFSRQEYWRSPHES